MSKVMIGVVVGFLVIIVGLVWSVSAGPGPHDTLAQCLVDEEAVMYGAWWCSACSQQKQLFAKSWNVFEDSGYIECSDANRNQIEACNQEGITSYPTWKFADGSQQTGVIALQSLAARTGCPMQ